MCSLLLSLLMDDVEMQLPHGTELEAVPPDGDGAKARADDSGGPSRQDEADGGTAACVQPAQDHAQEGQLVHVHVSTKQPAICTGTTIIA